MKRVLVADDDADVRESLRKVLVAAGYQVDVAGDGQSLLALHREKPADVLLIDIYMPDVDGLEAMIRLKSEFPGVKIIAISGGGFRDGADVLTMAAHLGAVRTVAKPFTVDEVVSAVREVVGRA
jgi:CheY-like chemotaxis protein